MTDVLVAQKDGEITVQINGDVHVLPVTKGKVSADDPDVLAAVLALPGSRSAPVASAPAEAKATSAST